MLVVVTVCEAVSCLQAAPDLANESLCTVVDEMMLFLNKDFSNSPVSPAG